ncbi:hypothetical protein AMAG_07118 [Allomyces macrogynus ATCC 38327]|uniref:Uncharacterized protein n=1 Tax=Allomyces macrogynus (strain ATCC 38327) TaxID=578462 RepID=A0A0L0SHB5_ALLM3|nr:hypothetical protein AMAG_07118 [Allomyces macrogynus ATCC 38327]|eukprot:KNE61842.1 hypothetical protein AMAG_07118 [Allomyces macrogynus ATCC 38327]
MPEVVPRNLGRTASRSLCASRGQAVALRLFGVRGRARPRSRCLGNQETESATSAHRRPYLRSRSPPLGRASVRGLFSPARFEHDPTVLVQSSSTTNPTPLHHGQDRV